MALEVEQITGVDGAAIQGFKAHPAAALMPWIGKKDVKELAADIKQNGLLQPILVVERDGQRLVLDGRNRLRAYKLAFGSVKDIPTDTYEGEDQTDAGLAKAVISYNIERRHLNKQERAKLRLKLIKAYGLNESEEETAKATDTSVHTVRKAKEKLKKGEGESKGGGRPAGGGPPRRVILDREEEGPAGLAKLVIEKWNSVPRGFMDNFVAQLTKQWQAFQDKQAAEEASGVNGEAEDEDVES